APTRRQRSRHPIGDVIVELGFASREAVDLAVARSRESGRTTGQILVESGELTQQQLAIALGERLGIDYIDLSEFDLDLGALALIPPELARRYQAVPVGFASDRKLVLAMADPTNIVTIDEVMMITGMDISPAAASEADIVALIRRLSHLETAVEVEEPEPEPELVVLETADDAPAVKLVH